MSGQESGATQSSADDRATTFQAVQGGPEHYRGEVLLVTAYATLWTIVLVWVMAMWRKQAQTSARLSELEQILKAENAKKRPHPNT
jgi:hypothetical protein